MAARGVHVGARVCLASDSAWRGVVESQAGGNYWAVQFADKSRNIRVNDLEVLPSDDATFEPSQAPPNAAESRQEEQATTMAARAVQVGARVCLASDSTRRGAVESHLTGGFWAVRFADKSRNIRVNDLVVLPSDQATFEPSQAPPSWAEKQQEERATTKAARGVQVGACVCLASDSARRGVVESYVNAGFWAVRFADKSRNIRVNDLEVLPSDDATFELSQAPLSSVEKEQEERATTKAARGVQVGARVCLVSDSARRGVVESQGLGGCWAVWFADKICNIRVNDLVVLPSDDATFEPSQAPPGWAEKKQEELATTMAARAVQVGARVCLASDSARRGVVEANVTRGYWAVRFADKSRNIRVNELEVLPSDDAGFEPSQAPPNAKECWREKRAKASAVDRALKAATPPVAASSRKRRAGGAPDIDAENGVAAAASAYGEELGDGASDDEPRVKRLRDLGPEALESAPLFNSLDDANREIARLRVLVVGALVETIDVDADGAVEAAAEVAARRRATTAPASGLAALASHQASHKTICIAIKEERDMVAEERDKVTEDRDDHEDERKTAHNFIERQKDVIGGLKDEIGGLRLEIEGLRREAQRRDEAGARRAADLEAAIAELEAAAIEAPPQPTKRRARPE